MKNLAKLAFLSYTCYTGEHPRFALRAGVPRANRGYTSGKARVSKNLGHLDESYRGRPRVYHGFTTGNCGQITGVSRANCGQITGESRVNSGFPRPHRVLK